MSRRRVVTICLGGLLVASIGLRLALPGIARRALVDVASEATGRAASLESVSLGLLGGRVALRGFALAGDAAPALELQSLSLRLSWRGLLSRELRIGDLALAGVRFRLGADEPFLRVAEAAPPPEPVASELEPVVAEPESVSSEPWPVQLEAITLRDVGVFFGDAPQVTRLDLAGLDLASLRIDAEGVAVGALRLDRPQLHTALTAAAPDPSEDGVAEEPFRFGALVDDLPGTRLEGLRLLDGALRLELDGGPIEVGLDFDAEPLVLQRGGETRLSIQLRLDGGSVALDGTLHLDPMRFEGTLRWADLELASLQPVLGDSSLGTGTSSAELEVSFAVSEQEAGEGLSAGAKGEVALLGARLEASDSAVLGWESLLVTLRELRFRQPASGAAPDLRVAVEALRWAGPDVAWVAPAGPAADAAVEPEPAAPASDDALALEVSVDLVQVVGGRVQVRDAGVKPPFEARGRFEASAEALHWPRRDLRRLSVSLTAEEGESVAVSGELEAGLGEIAADVESLGLTRFDGYASTHGGVHIKDGRLSWRGKVALAEDSTQVDGTLALAALSLEAPQGKLDQLLGIDVLGVPFDAALVMLRDAEGRISLPTQVRVDEGGTQVSLANIIATALRQALLNALTTPLATVRLLRDLAFDRGDVVLPHIAFAPGSTQPSEAAKERLVPLVELLQKRDDVVLLLFGRASEAEAALLTQPEGATQTPLERLGQERAAAAARILEQELGVPAERVSVQPTEEGSPGLHLVLRKR